MPGGFKWEVQYAKRKSRKGRAMGGIITGVRKGIRIEGKGRTDKGGMLEVMIEREGERWRLVGVYINGDLEEKLEEMNEWMEEEGDRVRTIIGGDFNARTGNLGGGIVMGEDEGEEGKGRKSKDTKVNGEGRRLVEKLKERGWAIMNGGVTGDEEGGWTYMGPKGRSVIDYVIGNEKVREEITKLEIGDRVDSDHMPVVIWIRGKGGGGEGKGIKRKRRWSWTKEGKEKFRERIGEIWEKQRDEQEEKGVEGEWEEKKRKIQEVLDKGKEGEGKERREKKRGWFDGECRREKGEVAKELKRWKRIGGKGEEYRKRKKEYKRLCRKKKEEDNVEWTRKAMEARTEGQVWEVVRRERGKGKGGMGGGIEIEEWNRYFRELLGGVESRVVMRGNRMEKGREEDQIEKGEIRRAIGRLKERKARWGWMGYREKCGNMEGRELRSGYGRYAIGYGRGKGGLGNGVRG
ncbi:cilia- and flagella-associated protein 251-like [Nylanderia fulva]|uniref:cilia- and flagella-associated protein 251-like n=1 Tax=Nylanderia fulva TaxID=613905 RepID=UPI0010FB8ED7|nr:cilia- and flagella-associated protein 251-like [Nylanderia fulva]